VQSTVFKDGTNVELEVAGTVVQAASMQATVVNPLKATVQGGSIAPTQLPADVKLPEDHMDMSLPEVQFMTMIKKGHSVASTVVQFS